MAEQAVNSTQHNADAYPSRGGRQPALAERKDPVVYSTNALECPIDYALVEQYERQGFLILENVFSEREVAAFQQELGSLLEDDGVKASEHSITEPGSGDIRSIFMVHETSLVFKKLAADPRLAGLARYLLNDQVYVHQSRLNYKPGFAGKEFYWHSDFETWHIEDGMPRMRALSISITLTENFDCNGPLMLVPGSHKSYAVCEGETPADHYKSSLKKQECGVPSNDCLSQLVEAGGIETATGKPGSIIVFDCNTMHGSNGNITPFPRSNAFFVYNALSNRVVEPFCDQPPRPEYICSRERIQPIDL
ncbi:ectoine hydroxylase [Marinobacterium arenosum]|uniref:ectoine hydroxylase n=1 Tax=Marinobacterium arenosum TaxID=2862496 RepID=UPI001C94DF66|nr:ectoine hydroxylase [Marinobacterium arenosum]MBY4677378.1 ectoine hydroxylase [Marinobacterium arenosum]